MRPSESKLLTTCSSHVTNYTSVSLRQKHGSTFSVFTPLRCLNSKCVQVTEWWNAGTWQSNRKVTWIVHSECYERLGLDRHDTCSCLYLLLKCCHALKHFTKWKCFTAFCGTDSGPVCWPTYTHARAVMWLPVTDNKCEECEEMGWGQKVPVQRKIHFSLIATTLKQSIFFWTHYIGHKCVSIKHGKTHSTS